MCSGHIQEVLININWFCFQVISKANLLSPEDKEELIQLISMTYDITLDRTKAGYGDTSPILEHIEGKIYPGKTHKILEIDY